MLMIIIVSLASFFFYLFSSFLAILTDLLEEDSTAISFSLQETYQIIVVHSSAERGVLY